MHGGGQGRCRRMAKSPCRDVGASNRAFLGRPQAAGSRLERYRGEGPEHQDQEFCRELDLIGGSDEF